MAFDCPSPYMSGRNIPKYAQKTVCLVFGLCSLSLLSPQEALLYTEFGEPFSAKGTWRNSCYLSNLPLKRAFIAQVESRRGSKIRLSLAQEDLVASTHA